MECDHSPKIKHVLLVKNRAKRFLIKNLVDGRIDKVQEQINRGTVKVLSSPKKDEPIEETMTVTFDWKENELINNSNDVYE